MDTPHPNSKFRYDQQVRVLGGPMAGAIGIADRFICSQDGVVEVRVHFPAGIFRYFTESELTDAATKPWRAPEWLLLMADRGETWIYGHGRPDLTDEEWDEEWYVTDREPQAKPNGFMDAVSWSTFDIDTESLAAAFGTPFTPPPGVQKLRITR